MKYGATFLFVVCLLVISSCRKDREVAKYTGDYELSGRVLDEITRQGIPYASVGVLEKNRGLTSNLGTKTAAAAYADAEGKFTLKFNANTNENSYELTAKASKYFDLGGLGDGITFTKNGKKNQDVTLMPPVYVSLIIKGNDIGFKLYVNEGGGPFYKGMDTSVIARMYPRNPLQVNYFIYDKYDSLIRYKKDLFPPPLPFDTVSHIIEF